MRTYGRVLLGCTLASAMAGCGSWTSSVETDAQSAERAAAQATTASCSGTFTVDVGEL